MLMLRQLTLMKLTVRTAHHDIIAATGRRPLRDAKCDRQRQHRKTSGARRRDSCGMLLDEIGHQPLVSVENAPRSYGEPAHHNTGVRSGQTTAAFCPRK